MSKRRFEPLSVPRRIILGPGPSSANPAVLRAMSQPIVGYLDPWYFEFLEEVSAMLAEVWQTQQRAFAVAGAGSAGMEAGLVSLLEPGEKVIVCSYGHFCERQITMCERLGVDVVPLRTEWGKQMDPQVLSDALKEHPDTRLVVSIHAETSTGVLQDIKTLCDIAHESGALFMTDCVTSLGGSPVEFDAWDLDFAYSGAQKCLAAPPGIAPVAMSERAYEHIKNRKRLPTSWYLDLKLIADYWSTDHVAHHTSPVSMVYGLREALALTLNEGLERRWSRHSLNAAALRAGLLALGLDLPVTEEDRLDQLTVIKLPAGVDDVKVRNQLLDEYNIEVGRGLGQFAGKVIRVGLMGESCVPANVLSLLNAFEHILPQHGFEIAAGEGAAAASRVLAEHPAPPY